MRRGAKPGKAKVDPRLSVARKSPKNEASGRRELEKRLAEALELQTATAEVLQTRNRELSEAQEQQTATAEILRVISRPPTDVQPVFDSIVQRAKRLCKGTGATLFQFDGTLIRVVALDYDTPEHFEAFRQGFPMRLDTPSVVVLAVTDRRVVHIADINVEPDVPAFSRDSARRFGYRSLLMVPMLRDGAPVGAIGVNRV
jgi:hypothetical protein